ncbi:MAG: hypothetical protein PHF57_09485 [Methanoregula sp.]|jgi:hypothetical protein|nr:hypothetical protein [Methanoregula sp.]MDD5188425.1 hypothetical protein [Methanoregula sp.]
MSETGEESEMINGDHPPTSDPDTFSPTADTFQNESPVGMTLERIIDLTGEFCHLNELVISVIDSRGGYTSPGAYLETVQPLLDRLELEIRIRYRSGMNTHEIKQIISEWIDRECGHPRI